MVQSPSPRVSRSPPRSSSPACPNWASLISMTRSPTSSVPPPPAPAPPPSSWHSRACTSPGRSPRIPARAKPSTAKPSPAHTAKTTKETAMARNYRRTRYGRYTGGPDPLAPPVDLTEALDAIGRDVMAGYSPEQALREYLRRGARGREGFDELARRAAERRRELLQRNNLGGTLREAKKLLDEAVLAERGQLARDVMMDDTDRSFRELLLDNLPQSTPAAITELNTYDWQSTEARQKFEQIKDLLGREMLDQQFAGMKQAMEGATDEDRAAIAEMLRDLNGLLAKHREGTDTPADFADFMAKHGEHFPENPRDINELIDALAARSTAAQRMLNSLSEEQRQELMELAAPAFGSPALQNLLGALAGSLQGLRPDLAWSGSEEFSGEEGMGLGDGTGAMQDLAEL